ncbi:MAG: hypothetical protein NZL93_06380, partial [Chthoniobacterales bacterium]|nr:hypothetical protein [Chthoniobacterales bacterium]
VSEAQFLILRRALKNAEAANARAFIINMDTPGGSLQAAVKILKLLLDSRIPTCTWVNTNAGSAGALIALGTQQIFMAPVSAIGAAAPILGTGQDAPQTLSEKIISYYSGYFRSAAERNGYNPELAEAFINKDKELIIDGQTISPKGSLLTLSAQEAVRTINGKPLLAKAIVQNLQQLTQIAGWENAPIYEFQPSGMEVIAQWITTLAPLFLLGGIIGAYLEFKSPGFGIPGTIAAFCFLMFFAGHYIAGLTGYETIVIFILGLLLILFETIFFPGLAIFSILGALLMIGSLFFAMIDFWPSRPFTLNWQSLAPATLNFSLAFITAIIAISLLARFLPSTPLFHFLFLKTQTATGPSLPTSHKSLIDKKVNIGDIGVATTPLRPTGKALFGVCLADVTTEGDF